MNGNKIKILLTGASGFVGRNFIDLAYRFCEITVLVRESSNVKNLESKCKIIVLNKNDNVATITSLLEQNDFTCILHLATLYISNHKQEDIYNLIDSNIAFGVEILESMKKARFSGLFLNTLSFSQFANALNYNPKTFYCSTKQAFFDIAKYYIKHIQNATFSNILLYDNYGTNDTRPKIFNLWAKLLQSGQSMDMSSGEQCIDISHISDVVAGIICVISLYMQGKIIQNGIYALQNKRYSLKELANIFESATGKHLNINWGAKDYAKDEIFMPISIESSNGLLLKIPNFTPQVSLESGIKDMLGIEKLNNDNKAYEEILSSASVWGGATKRFNISKFKLQDFADFIDKRLESANFFTAA